MKTIILNDDGWCRTFRSDLVSTDVLHVKYPDETIICAYARDYSHTDPCSICAFSHRGLRCPRSDLGARLCFVIEDKCGISGHFETLEGLL